MKKDIAKSDQFVCYLFWDWCESRSVSSTDPGKPLLFPKTSSVWQSFVFQDVLNTYLQNVLQKRLQEVFQTSSQDVFKTFSRRLQDVFQTSSRRVKTCLQDIFFKTSSRRLQEVFKKTSCKDVLEDKKMLHRKRLQDIFKTSSVRLYQHETLLGHCTKNEVFY